MDSEINQAGDHRPVESGLGGEGNSKGGSRKRREMEQGPQVVGNRIRKGEGTRIAEKNGAPIRFLPAGK
jgi:hypothetical protein